MEILVHAIIFSVGVSVGYLLKAWFTIRFRDYSGTIFVEKDEEKTLYSLELDDDPETLQFRKILTFKVDSSVENLDRS